MFHDTVVNKPMHLSLYMERRYVLIKNIAYFEVATPTIAEKIDALHSR